MISSKQNPTSPDVDGLILSGYQKKLKTMKKKYFVVFKKSMFSPARLEYFDNEKKFRSGQPPKRVIKLKHCFNINRRLDTKHDYVIALSTKDGGFGIVLESEEEMLKWMEALISLQRCDVDVTSSSRPHFEHVWQVLVQKKGLAEEKGIFGNYHICLTHKSVTFLRIGPEKYTNGDLRLPNIEFLLTTIRRCGDSQCFFYMEVGRQSIIGPGELWMETEDSMTAQNMHHMILCAMSSKGEPNIEPMRKRSSSANEASKPINVLQRQIQPDNKTNSPQTNICFGRERCDSLPSRNRTSSESGNQNFTSASVFTIRNSALTGFRPHSYQRHSNSPPVNSSLVCSESEESSISVDEPDDNCSFLSYRFKSSADGVIPEENTEELINSDNKSSESIEAITATGNNDSLKINGIESYVSMVPVKPNQDFAENCKFNLIKATSSASSSITHANSPDYSGSPKYCLEFREYVIDNNVTRSCISDIDLQSERPVRAYSIGSKVEHSKTSKRLGHMNEAEQNTTRVRAFSVGSHAKIPRCDLQRSSLLQKSINEPNINYNNNICSSTDVILYNQLLSSNASRDKKSTSAPLLIHKSHNSVDRMSDLMEIDFSKSSNNTIQNTYNIPEGGSTGDDGKKYITEMDTSYRGDHNFCSAVKTVATTDNGYLEMKPVGNLPKIRTPEIFARRNDEYLDNKPKMFSSSDISKTKAKLLSSHQCAVLANKNDAFNNMSLDCKSEKKIEENYTCKNPIIKNVAHLRSNIDKGSKYLKETLLSSKYAELTLKANATEGNSISDKDEPIANEKTSEYALVRYGEIKNFQNKGKIVETDNTIQCVNDDFDLDAKAKSSNNSGYEILQIKSDSSLQSHISLNKAIDIREETQQIQPNEIRPISTNSSIGSLSTFSECTSSSATCFNYAQAKPSLHSDAMKDLNISSRFKNNTSYKIQLNSSRPPSVSSDCGLNYAKLDWSNKDAFGAKTYKTDTLTDLSPASYNANVNNSYAKIDFELSDSSSSSSKNFNL